MAFRVPLVATFAVYLLKKGGTKKKSSWQFYFKEALVISELACLSTLKGISFLRC